MQDNTAAVEEEKHSPSAKKLLNHWNTWRAMRVILSYLFTFREYPLLLFYVSSSGHEFKNANMKWMGTGRSIGSPKTNITLNSEFDGILLDYSACNSSGQTIGYGNRGHVTLSGINYLITSIAVATEMQSEVNNNNYAM
ncbi:unnamed protein product, partial [Prunus armeniaca]